MPCPSEFRFTPTKVVRTLPCEKMPPSTFPRKKTGTWEPARSSGRSVTQPDKALLSMRCHLVHTQSETRAFWGMVFRCRGSKLEDAPDSKEQHFGSLNQRLKAAAERGTSEQRVGAGHGSALYAKAPARYPCGKENDVQREKYTSHQLRASNPQPRLQFAQGERTA